MTTGQDLNRRMNQAVAATHTAFGTALANCFPEADSGDVAPDAQLNLDVALMEFAWHWIEGNVPGAHDVLHPKPEEPIPGQYHQGDHCGPMCRGWNCDIAKQRETRRAARR